MKKKYYLIILIYLFSCATPSSLYEKINSFISTDNYNHAIKELESQKKSYGKNNILLYYLEKGILHHYAGSYDESNIAFAQAEKISNDLFTKSITQEALTFLLNDYAKPYYGEDFERAMINMFMSLNYLFLNSYEDALVEARKVDHLLTVLQTNYGYKNVYKEDAFIRYLMGLIYEDQKEINDAYISYWKSIDAYERYVKYFKVSTPNNLIDRGIFFGEKLGFNEDVVQLKKKYKISSKYEKKANYGEIVLIHYNGSAPQKIDQFIEVSFGECWGYVEYVEVKGEDAKQVEIAKATARGIASDEQVRVAFPKYEKIPYQINSSIVECSGESGNITSSDFLVQDIENIAIQNLNDRIARIRTKTLARAAIKYSLAKLAEEKVGEKKGEVAGWLAKTIVKTIGVVTEEADKRSWRLLPGQIRLTILNLAPGIYNLKINFYDKQDNLVTTKTISNVKVISGKKRFLTIRTIL